MVNLTRYKMKCIYDNEQGEWVKLADAMGASSNSLQQLNVAIALWKEALDAHRGQNVDAWFWANIDKVNAVIAQHATV
jgi:hypothetical protein